MGPIIHIKRDLDIRFEYYFIAIRASIRRFQHMHSMVAVDGTFVKNRYGGILYITSCLDMNEQIYLLAFVIGQSENDTSSTWFFSKFKEAFGDCANLMFITDRYRSFVSAIL